MNDTKTVFDRFREFSVEVKKDRTGRAVSEMLIAIQGYSTANVPVDTANLARSIWRQLQQRGDSWAGVVYYTAKYAPWVHQMSGKLRGQPRADFGMTGNQSAVGPQRRVAFGGGSGTGHYWDSYSGKGAAKTQFLAKAVEEMILKDFDRIIRKYY